MRNLLSLFLMLSLMTEVMAQTSLPVKKISIFKNNTAMVIKEGNATVHSGKVSVPVPSNVIFGTYFIGSVKDNPIKNILVRNDTLKRKLNATAIWQLLAGNVGKYANISYSLVQKFDKTISGKILSYNLQSGLVRLKEDNGKIAAINSADIYLAEFADEESQIYTADSIQRSLVISPQNAADNLALQEIYMQTGMGWIPSYFLILKSDKTAHLEMKATIENFADAINDSQIELIVGSPQMTYSGKNDPITYDYRTMDGGAAAAAPQAYLSSNAMQTMSVSYGWAAPGNTAFDESFSADGEKNDDMYIYKIGKVTLDKNAKGIYPIFGGNIEYKDKYEGTVYDKTNYFYSHATDNEETPIDVYHSLEIKNSSGVPLTTAPVTVINDKDQFMAQDQIKYTPVGASCDIRLSKAVDIIMKNSEDETGRTDNAKKIAKTVYSRANLTGKVTLENYQNKEVTVCVTKEVNGDVTVASENGKIVKPKGRTVLNPYTQIKWEIKLAPNEKKTLTYGYDVLFQP